jgi:hypothetical protein
MAAELFEQPQGICVEAEIQQAVEPQKVGTPSP